MHAMMRKAVKVAEDILDSDDPKSVNAKAKVIEQVWDRVVPTVDSNVAVQINLGALDE